MRKVGIRIIIISVLVWFFFFIMLFPDANASRLPEKYIQHVKNELYGISVLMALLFSFGIWMTYCRSSKVMKRKDQDEQS